MKNFTDTTVRVTATIYQQLQHLWRVGYDQGVLHYLDHAAPEAYQLARQLGLEQAAQWIQLHQVEYTAAQQHGHWGLDTGKARW